MISNYRKIGDFIELVDERNKDLSINLLLGLSISKEFIPSVANTIGTNMKNYKIIRKGQFACSVMQVRRDKKMPVALLQDFDEAIISQAYPVFQIKDESQLLPEYLMMWFTRSEFDREACFHAVGGVRGSLEWEDFLNMKLPVPSIEKQLEIVKEYNTVVNRIKLNEQLNQKLEETAQALYKHWFVDFEFPNEEGKPYKSSGGAMVYNEELDMEIPVGWEVKTFSDVAEISAGGDKPRVFSGFKTKECHVPIFSNGVTEEGLYGFTNEAKIFKNSITI
ncbi:MAG TPA: restriction endonuclease subunit S, partial [Flavobacteriaceae bacterium]|nr:restriction endonuclease subunit S [Flavobacteriaceae bacterium]